MSELATLRWADVQSLQFLQPGQTGNLGANSVGLTKQLVMATWRVPMSWNVILVAAPTLLAGETGSLKVNWLFTLGAGQATMGEIPLFSTPTFTLAAQGVNQQQQLIPSQSLQIRAQVLAQNLVNPATMLVGAFVAPNNAEIGVEEIAARILAGEAAGDDKGTMRYMPMGFYGDLDPLHYKPR